MLPVSSGELYGQIASSARLRTSLGAPMSSEGRSERTPWSGIVIRVFMDESGVHSGARAVTSSAVWARPSVWKQWTNDWVWSKRPINVFHAVDCHNRKGEFEGWSREERDAVVLRLLPLFPKHRICGRFSGIHLKAYGLAMKDCDEISDKFGEPYFACVYWTFKKIFEAVSRSNSRKIEIIHESGDFHKEILEAFEFVKTKFPDIESTLEFGTKAEYVPLQAADLVAYEGFKYLDNGSAPRKPMRALDPTGKRMFLSVYDIDTAWQLAELVKDQVGALIRKSSY